MTKYNLMNAEALSRASATFHIPSRTERHSLKKGDLAKLIFEQNGEGERMWVLVKRASKNGTYTGTLDNYPSVISGLHAGDMVRFRASHVISIDKAAAPPTKPRATRAPRTYTSRRKSRS